MEGLLEDPRYVDYKGSKSHTQYLMKAFNVPKLAAGHLLYVIAEATDGSGPVDIMAVELCKPLSYSQVRFGYMSVYRITTSS
jgi:hypothetical protein